MVSKKNYYLVGDTAQSILKDSQFRFAHAKERFYARFSDRASSVTKDLSPVPALLPLCRNFRSHRGILCFSSVVMDILLDGRMTLADLCTQTNFFV
jgi:hypothetical protein